jgi:hypothetical protein
MNTCANCYFWHPENPGDPAGNCWFDPPKIFPIMKPDRSVVMQAILPPTERDFYCHNHDSTPRPVIKLATRMPGKG